MILQVGDICQGVYFAKILSGDGPGNYYEAIPTVCDYLHAGALCFHGWGGLWICVGGVVVMEQYLPFDPESGFQVGRITINVQHDNDESGRQAARVFIEELERIQRETKPPEVEKSGAHTLPRYLTAWDFSETDRKGWICPKCDSSVSPDEKTCPNCSTKKPKTESDSGKTHIQE